MAVINGAKSVEEVIHTVKGGFFAVIRVNWIVSPLSMVVAQQFIPVELWVPFFNIIQFALGTLFNIKVKKLRLAAAKEEGEQKERERAESTIEDSASGEY
jgi:peroxisomal membrane protein 2